MKKLLSILFIAFTVSVFGQNAISEGKAITKTTMSSSNSEVNAQFAMIGDIQSVTYFKDNFSRTETANIMTGNSVNVIDGNAKEMLMYMDNAMMGKQYIKKSIVPSEEDLNGVQVEKTLETKDFLGYNCTKYVATVDKNGGKMNMEIYTTDKISAISGQTANLGAAFEGFPLLIKMMMNQQGIDMTITMEVTEIKAESVSSDIFDMTPPEGYKLTDNLMGM